jgi:hypothetical protein
MQYDTLQHYLNGLGVQLNWTDGFRKRQSIKIVRTSRVKLLVMLVRKKFLCLLIQLLEMFMKTFLKTVTICATH